MVRRSRPVFLISAVLALVMLTGLAIPRSSAAEASAYAPSPFDGRTLYVDPYSNAANDARALASSDPEAAEALRRVARGAQADWFGDWNPTDRVASDVSARVSTIRQAGAYPVFVVYNIPKRDCASYSSGGAPTAAAYRAWIDQFRAGIGSRPAAVIVEPDALSLMSCLTPAEQDVRSELIKYAARTLSSGGNIAVYLDAGHAYWVPASEMSSRLAKAGIYYARGFALNVSNFGYTADQIAYGRKVAPSLGWKRFVVDTSRNGLGPATGIDEAWCNPPGRALGAYPTANTGDRIVDAFLWIKRPGESDGTCNGGPVPGTWWREYAIGLGERAAS